MNTPNTLLAEQEPAWQYWGKRVGIALVVAAGVVKANFPDGSAVEVACEVVVAVGAAFGIASAGLRR